MKEWTNNPLEGQSGEELREAGDEIKDLSTILSVCSRPWHRRSCISTRWTEATQEQRQEEEKDVNHGPGA